MHATDPGRTPPEAAPPPSRPPAPPSATSHSRLPQLVVRLLKALVRRLLHIAALVCWYLGLTVTLAVLFAPPVFFFICGTLAVALAARALATLPHLVSGAALDAAAQVATLDQAGGLGLLSSSYFVLLFALTILWMGLAGRGWERLWLVIALPLGAAMLALFLLGTELALPGLLTGYATRDMLRLLTGAALVLAVALAGMLANPRPWLARLRHLSRRMHSIGRADPWDLPTNVHSLTQHARRTTRHAV